MLIYYSVIAKQFRGDNWSIQFGDYERENVESEAEYMRESGERASIKIIRTVDSQKAIETEVNRLNNWFIKG